MTISDRVDGALEIEAPRQAIREEYATVARNPAQGFHFLTGRRLARLREYDDTWLDKIPKSALASFIGTGYPFRVGTLLPGERVVDVGCGAGPPRRLGQDAPRSGTATLPGGGPSTSQSIQTSPVPSTSARRSSARVCPLARERADHRHLRVRTLDDPAVDWTLRLGSTWVTRTVSLVGSLVPPPVWRWRPTLSVMGRVAGSALGAGTVQLTGMTANGQRFDASPLRRWYVTDSAVVVDGEELGPIGPLAE